MIHFMERMGLFCLQFDHAGVSREDFISEIERAYEKAKQGTKVGLPLPRAYKQQAR
jgi:hypothetical protein